MAGRAPEIVPPPSTYADPTEHRRQLADASQRTIRDAFWHDGRQQMTEPLPPAAYTDSPNTRPGSALYEGAIIYISDLDRHEFWDGSEWKPMAGGSQLTQTLSVVILATDKRISSANTWTKVDSAWTVVWDPAGLWNAAQNRFDLPAEYVSFNVQTQIQMQNETTNDNIGMGAGLGFDGNAPNAVTQPIEIENFAGVDQKFTGGTDVPAFTTLSPHTPTVPFFDSGDDVDSIDLWIAGTDNSGGGSGGIWARAGANTWMALEVIQ